MLLLCMTLLKTLSGISTSVSLVKTQKHNETFLLEEEPHASALCQLNFSSERCILNFTLILKNENFFTIGCEEHYHCTEVKVDNSLKRIQKQPNVLKMLSRREFNINYLVECLF